MENNVQYSWKISKGFYLSSLITKKIYEVMHMLILPDLAFPPYVQSSNHVNNYYMQLLCAN